MNNCFKLHRRLSSLIPLPPMSVEKFDLRVGLITAVSKHPNADSLFVETIDLAEPTGPRQVLSGLVKHLREEDLLQQRVLVCCNLKPAKMRGMDSYGMLLCAVKPVGEAQAQTQPAQEAADEIVRLVKPPADAPVGERVSFEADSFPFDPSTAPAAIDGRKGDAQLFQAVFGSGKFRTDAEGVACFEGKKMMTSTGPCRSELCEANIQ